MAPKKQPLEDAAATKPAKKAKSEADEKKGDMSAFVTCAKHLVKTAPDTKEGKEAKASLEFYQQLGRFDAEKSSIIANWKKNNKKFAFWAEYSKTRSKSASAENEANTGYGTKSIT